MATNKRLIKSNEGGAAVPTSFNTIIWDGDVSTSRDITDVGFQPDFVWIKPRTNTNWHQAFDSVRGVAKTLFPNETFAPESVSNSAGYLSSFNNDGFTVLAGSVSDINVNQINEKYVAWCWKAGGAAVTNTDGTITSQVSANTEAGFSIVSYTGSVSINQTVGHGLDSKPDMIIVKNRSIPDQSWAVYNSNLTADYHLLLNTTQEAKNNVDWIWNDTEPTDSVFTVGQFGLTNQNPDEFIAYCWHSVEGFSSFGSYVGTGASGNTVVTGFEPAFVMIKKTSSAGEGWIMQDNKRGSEKVLQANESAAEADYGVNGLTFVSDGFSIPNAYGQWNASGQTYIYMAFANQF